MEDWKDQSTQQTRHVETMEDWQDQSSNAGAVRKVKDKQEKRKTKEEREKQEAKLEES